MMFTAFAAMALVAMNENKAPDLQKLPPRFSEKPCELLKYYGRQGQFTFGGQIFTAKDIAEANQAFGDYSNEPIVNIKFTPSGKAKFQTAQKVGVGGRLPICLNKKTISVPILNEPIGGGQVQISGGFTVETARAFARRIKFAA